MGLYSANRGIQKSSNIELRGIRHKDCGNSGCSIRPHHAVKSPAATFFIEEGIRGLCANVPSERHRNGFSRIKVLSLEQHLSDLSIEDSGLCSELVLKKLRKPACRSNQSANRGTIQIMISNAQPAAFVTIDPLRLQHKSFDEIQEGILLQISFGVRLFIRNRVVEFLR
jgi:hypothetical protein